ncbi:MAG: hypothetical protein DMG44_16190 [Acidobacteria bacterium]|nr:MAG: hypothetical protein DMG44_16190 [Acidobacteriota bacterium]
MWRPRKIVDTNQIATLRAQGVGWKRIAAEMGVGVGTVIRASRRGRMRKEREHYTAEQKVAILD